MSALLREELSVEEAATVAAPAPLSADGDVVREDGTIRTVVIRPCVSRGARIRNLPPIYTPKMLREHAGVFTNWPMFRDHAIVIAEAEAAGHDLAAEQREMAEAIAEQWMATTDRLTEAVKKVGRSIDDLAGRIVRSWWDPDVVFEDDAEFGYQRGAVVGLSLLLPTLREKVSADPGLFHTSINGYPTAGRPSTAPWDSKLKGMAIEGIRKVPMGSVDVVVRGGAGGRFVRSKTKAAKAPVAEREVSPVKPGYAAPHMADVSLSEATTPDQLRAYITENAPQLATLLSEGSGTPSAAAPAAAASAAAPAAVTRADIDTALREAREDFTRQMSGLREEVKTTATASVDTDRQARIFEAEATRLIEAAGKDKGGFLPASWVADLKARYSVKPSGPMPALLVEAETDPATGATKDSTTVLREMVTADIEYARKLIAEAAGHPVVAGQGAVTVEESAAQRTGQRQGQSWVTELDSLRMLEHDDSGKPKLDSLYESMVS